MNNTNLTTNLEAISDQLVHIAEMTADDGTRDQLHRLVGDLESIIDGIPQDEPEDDASDDFMQRLASAIEQRQE